MDVGYDHEADGYVIENPSGVDYTGNTTQAGMIWNFNNNFGIEKSTAYFRLGMTEKEFNRKNPNITEKNDDEEFPIYIENCKDKYTYIAGKAYPLPHCEEYTFAFKNDTLEAVYRGRNNFNREIDYSKYSNQNNP